MAECPRCNAVISSADSLCPACGSSVRDGFAETAVLPDPQSDTPTRLQPHSGKRSRPSSATGGTGRFVTGTVLAGRYRVVGLVGKGGMGEVYKAEDLELEQAVALKFLPENLSNNEHLLKRFRAEVRNARRVSHRNVCRVFDIGETEGLHYITMEYIDGDDLSVLLRRIGRLPSDKAVEISRQICMGLAAIHKSGILHRDLKPANIIIDSNGEARITDFGIAAIETEGGGDEAGVGTPAYMSPEQADGREATQLSDIYSLGLVLYEIFTGKPAFEGDSVQELRVKHATTDPTNPSDIVKGIDPVVESVITRCLEKNPQGRPESALRVAMSLPGGDPLQVAIEAGETPSPEMVAAAPKVGSLRPIAAASLLGLVFIAFGMSIVVSKYAVLYRMVPMDKSVDVLQERGRELVERFGYSQMDSVSGFVQESGYIDHLRSRDPSPDRLQRLMAARPAVLQFWYRTSPKPLVPLSGAQPSESDPPQTLPGMVRLRLDTKGRLVYFNGVPPRVDAEASSAGEFDWSQIFRESGLDAGAFQLTESQWTPPAAFDERRAFIGTYAENSDIAVRIEAAAYRGRLVSFEVVEPWTIPPGKTDARSEGPLPAIGTAIMFSVYFGVLFFSTLLAIRNIRARRSHIRGSFRIMIFLFFLRMVYWIFATHHVVGEAEVNNFITGLQSALYWASFGGLLYLAFEPSMRRSAPERVISWNRLLAGDWRDPLVGRDLLIGAAGGAFATVQYSLLAHLVPRWLGHVPGHPFLINSYLLGLGGVARTFVDDLSWALLVAFMISFMILFLGLLFRRKWLGAWAVWSVVAVMIALYALNGNPPLESASFLVTFTILIALSSRFGVVAVISCWMFTNLQEIPFGTWFASSYAAYVLTLLAIATFGFYTSTAGGRLWQGKLIEE
jgi:RNA polymerase subunit RPABC4/transcription elongation factor Spt4